MKIYADNAATTKISENALAVMIENMKLYFANPSSLHTPGQLAKEQLEQAREEIAQAIGAKPREIFFTSGGSESDNQAICSAAYAGKRKGKNHIITTTVEHHAVLHTMAKLAKDGFEVTYLPVDEDGWLDPQLVREAIREETALVSVMYANNEVGTLLPVKEIGAICKEKKVPFHTDAVQAVGHVPVDVREIGCDYLALSGHKFHGPRGVGALYVRMGARIDNLIEGGAQERGKRAGTENIPAIVGMATALKEALNQLEENMEKTAALRDYLEAGLSKISHSKINGSGAERVPGTLNICFEAIEGESLLLLLDAKGIAASSGSACTSGSLDPSHVLLALGLPHEVAHGSLRLSVSEENTYEQMDYIIEQVKEVVSYLRSISPVWESLKKGEKEYIFK
ncbi:cysteine desulfurase NifS [Eubacterium oxidoreducens]|uniref:Cysteine desulfurase n=1 Tax=Eubacterium oxidoreducens TaxID=1732 RepID=A0A1G6CH88_EUBOX|nr:cysteine desulfurase NifS [Eubacterium oxidoreducens]SDB32240.1 cysteine desulfurase [Eubacterium oxidoreducens]